MNACTDEKNKQSQRVEECRGKNLCTLSCTEMVQELLATLEQLQQESSLLQKIPEGNLFGVGMNMHCLSHRYSSNCSDCCKLDKNATCV